MKQITKDTLKIYQLTQENIKLRKDISAFRKRLMYFCDTIEQRKEPKYTGWYILLKKEKNKWVSLGVFNPDISEDSAEPEWDICLPIPTKESFDEFMGW